ncbi:hypothetical protein [Cognatilysobacter segetis]|uniref:hypothetical protein n=1 Tax=Cognatilysobacter segetis TaxID=2492394 RepID=UPI00106201CC|nr:hypothetical protein [Lysobacter segetis]
MTTRSNWSIASPTLRLELRPSRRLAAALQLIGLLGGAGLFLTNLPAAAAWSLAPLVVVWGGLLARRVLRAPAVGMVFGADGRVHVDGAKVDEFILDARGPLTCMAWRSDGRRRRLVAWPDAVAAPLRRELRLWRLAHRADASTRPVAP